jgi:hypothetical protein
MRMPKKEGRATYRENQYRVIIFYPGMRKPAKYRKCELENADKYRQFLAFIDQKFPGWTAVNVYEGLSRKFLRQINQKNR